MEIGEKNFKTIYSNLNTAQKQAVDTIDGPVMVIAGPGTGKTQILAARIANILLKTDTKPANILALTFTDAAAKNMRERVVQMIGKAGFYVHITTFHAFCKDVIETHPEYFFQSREAQALTDIERFEIFQDILSTAALDTLKPLNAPLFYIRDIIKAISDLKKEGITPQQFETLVEENTKITEKETKTQTLKREKNYKKQMELAVLYGLYQERLQELERYDFDDMIMFVMEAFQKHEELLLEYQENFHYFLVDEYQDTNSAQNTVVTQLASFWGDVANVFVVGDPNQSIYRFQGASVENMLQFVEQYPQATVITLEIGYRSTQIVYDAAHELIQNNSLIQTNDVLQKTNQRLKSNSSSIGSIDFFAAPSDIIEIVSVVDRIYTLIQAGTLPEEIAVLYRNNSDVVQLQEVLNSKQIRYETVGGIDVLQTSEIQQFVLFLELIIAIRNGQDTTNLFEVFSFEWFNLKKVAVLELARFAGTNKITLIDALEKGYTFYIKHCQTCLITETDWQSLEEKLSLLKTLALTELSVNLVQWFTAVLTESGYLEWLKSKPDNLELLLHLNSFFAELRNQSSAQAQLKLEGFLHNISLMKEHGISIQAQDLQIKEGSVVLTTAHSAKGKEWEHVFIIGVTDGKWGNSRKRELLPLPEGILKNTDISKKEKNEDDRRLFYVALTRAKKHTYISYPKTKVEASKLKDILPSMFIEEIQKHLTDVSQPQTDKISKEAEQYIIDLLSPSIITVHDIQERQFYKEIVKNFSLSITALNDYLRDPKQFAYKHLLRVPESRSEAQMYGTAMHRALEYMYRQWCLEHKTVTLQSILTVFETELHSQALHIEDFERRLQKGKQSLEMYFNQVMQLKPQVISLEKMFGRGLSKTYLDDVSLNGRIDRIDWLDKKQNTAKVIDYKTGKPKTHNDIAGTTATSQKDFSQREKDLPEMIRGPYKRQLLFYKLLAELDETFKPVITEGEFDFVEPDAQTDKLIKRIIPLENDETEALKKLIKQVMQEIKELAFLN